MTTEEKILNTSPSKQLVELAEDKKTFRELRDAALREIGLEIPASTVSYPSRFANALLDSKYAALVDHWRVGIDRENDNFVLMTMPYNDAEIEGSHSSFKIIQANHWTVHNRGADNINCFFIILPLKKAKSIALKRSFHRRSADVIIEEVLG